MTRRKKDPRALDRHRVTGVLVRPESDAELAEWRAYAERVGKPLTEVVREAVREKVRGSRRQP